MALVASFGLVLIFLAATATRLFQGRTGLLIATWVVVVLVGWAGTAIVAGDQAIRHACGDTVPCAIDLYAVYSGEYPDEKVNRLVMVQEVSERFGGLVWAAIVAVVAFLVRAVGKRAA